MKRIWIALLLGAWMVGCSPSAVVPTSSPIPSSTPPPPRETATGGVESLWIGAGVPDELRQAAQSWELPIATDASNASLSLDFHPGAQTEGSRWIYALVAPFPTVLDGVASADLQAVWHGSSSVDFGRWPLWMTSSTLSAFSALWGPPTITVHVAPAEKLLDSAWAQMPSWAIVPFESIEPRWKVLTVDGQSPIRKDFNPASYPLDILFSLSSSGSKPAQVQLPSGNWDPSKMTTVIMTGTSSLVREIAYQMEVKGIDYPATDIGDWLRQADILHISNEVAFDPTCPPPDPLQNRFYCSDPRYIGLLDDVGVDVVELTGNHILDNGTASLLYTLQLYRRHGMSYFGGGANLSDASKPLLIENHGNKIAFLGCNAGEPPEPIATTTLPGANPCVWSELTAQISQLRDQGYLPIVTFQYKEGYSPMVMPWQSFDFRRAATAGAVVVSGSQSHVPLQMEFYQSTFIHYGLGNLFFGQMGNQPPGPGLPIQPAERYEFLDRHVFYDGRYISTELLTAMLEDYSRPRPITPDERAATLTTYFAYSGWQPLIPTPAPEQTPTRYPLLHFDPLPTHTPFPDGTPTP